MDQRLSDTPEDEAARAQRETGEQTPKQARTRKSESTGASRTPKSSARKKASDAAENSTAKLGAKPVVKKPRATSAKRRQRVREEPLAGLAAQGFSEGEAARLLEVSERAASSAEARESEAVMNRLRFTRWLIERGVINEFVV
jgi:hypothetical protein